MLAKPGIIFGNLNAVAVGYFLAARGSVEPTLLLATVLGLAQVVASGS
ncbi:heme o synthase, partial [Pseudomonas aeruginosa]